MNIAVFISGNGSNLQALIDAEKAQMLSSGKISLVVSNKPGAYGLTRAQKNGIKTYLQEVKDFSSREEYDKKVSELLENENIDLIVLAGFMRLLSEWMVNKYSGKILNIHPSLLPEFKGTHSIKDAFEAGGKVTGVTVHFVNKELDAGPIILQEKIAIEEIDILETLEEKIHKVEHRVYPEAVKLFVEGKLRVDGTIVRILK